MSACTEARMARMVVRTRSFVWTDALVAAACSAFAPRAAHAIIEALALVPYVFGRHVGPRGARAVRQVGAIGNRSAKTPAARRQGVPHFLKDDDAVCVDDGVALHVNNAVRALDPSVTAAFGDLPPGEDRVVLAPF